MYDARDMTLCIGALTFCDTIKPEPCIALCFDSLASCGDVYSSETEHKFRVLSDNLVCLFAGSTARAKELAMIYQGLLKHEPLPADPTGALEYLRKGPVELKRRLANSYAGARLAVSYDDLRQNGEAWFGHDRWQRHIEAIDKHDPNVEMIIAGFIGKVPLLYRIAKDTSGWLDVEPVTNFCAIGTGAYTAEPALHAREQAANGSLPKTLYNIYEAKKIGETSPAVGKKTAIIVARSERKEDMGVIRLQRLGGIGEKALQRLFRKHGPKPVMPFDLPDGSLQDTVSIRGRAGMV